MWLQEIKKIKRNQLKGYSKAASPLLVLISFHAVNSSSGQINHFVVLNDIFPVFYKTTLVVLKVSVNVCIAWELCH